MASTAGDYASRLLLAERQEQALRGSQAVDSLSQRGEVIGIDPIGPNVDRTTDRNCPSVDLDFLAGCAPFTFDGWKRLRYDGQLEAVGEFNGYIDPFQEGRTDVDNRPAV